MFAYLDASHKYKPTLNELIHLNDQMAPGGVIMGDGGRACSATG